MSRGGTFLEKGRLPEPLLQRLFKKNNEPLRNQTILARPLHGSQGFS
jgi:hypothetical protein